MIIIKRKPIIENGRVMIVKTQFNEFKQNESHDVFSLPNQKINKLSKGTLKILLSYLFNLKWTYLQNGTIFEGI